MKSFLTTIILLATITACATIKPVPVETIIQYQTRDSLVVRDSVVTIPKERIVDVVQPYDTLEMETSMAEARAWVDTTTHTLKGELTNKTGIQYKYKDREKIVYRDSLVYKEVPVEVEKLVKTHYRYEKWLWIYIAITLALIGLYIYSKLK